MRPPKSAPSVSAPARSRSKIRGYQRDSKIQNSRSIRRKYGRRVRLRSSKAIWRRSTIAFSNSVVRVRGSPRATGTAPLVGVAISQAIATRVKPPKNPGGLSSEEGQPDPEHAIERGESRGGPRRWRRRTASWWRSAMTSRSNSARLRNQPASHERRAELNAIESWTVLWYKAT